MPTQQEYEQMSDAEKKKEDWMNAKWRPMMGWMYMLVCVADFVIFPILWGLLQTLGGGRVETQWMPITLQGAGLFHIAMGAILGIAAYGRTQEKLNGANNGGITPPVNTPSFGAPTVASPTPAVAAPAPSFGSVPLGNNSVSTAPAFGTPTPTFGNKPLGPGQAPQPEL